MLACNSGIVVTTYFISRAYKRNKMSQSEFIFADPVVDFPNGLPVGPRSTGFVLRLVDAVFLLVV